MLAQIQSVEELETAIQLMVAGRQLITGGLIATLIVFGLGIGSAVLKDERLSHAARRGQYALFFLTSVCVGLLYLGIFDGYYFVRYVGHVTENAETLPFKISALWASQQGSLLFWCFILTGFGAFFAFSQRHNRTDRRMPYTLAVIALVEFFFFYIMSSPFSPDAANMTNPFAMDWAWMVGAVKNDAGEITGWNGAQTIAEVLREGGIKSSSAGREMLSAFLGPESFDVAIASLQGSKWGAMSLTELHAVVQTDASSLPAGVKQSMLSSFSEGGGMNPALHNYWIAIHPPMLYLGFVGFTIPFAYAIGSLLSGEVNEGWLRPIRLWTMASWGFLTVGIALGGLWAYEILGWGGFWAWDPVENASFVPWLTGTAFIHSIIVTERRGMLRIWSFALITITYCMTVIGTFLVRSGIINSVHAFGATGDNSWFYGFIGIMLFGSLFLLLWRAPLLKSDRKLESLWSREGSFIINNLAFLGLALTTLIITFWPLITRTFYGDGGEVELGADAYVMINIPLFLLLFLLMGIGPALSWRHTSKQQLVRAFLPPTLAAIIVGVANYFWLSSRGLMLDADAGDNIQRASTVVRQMVQITLWPISAFTLVCIIMEFASGTRARMRGTGKGFLSSLFGVALSNRRRYGGYIVHIGLLMIGLGIYYSSFYEVGGSIHTSPGGYTVLTDKVSGDKFLVYYDSNERSENWDRMDDVFGNAEKEELYKNLFAHVRQNRDKSAQQIIDGIEKGGAIAPAMRKAVIWAVDQMESDVVYEDFHTSLRIFPYEEPTGIDVDGYRQHDGDTRTAMYADANSPDNITYTAAYYVRTFILALLASDEDVLSIMDERKKLIENAKPEDFLQNTGLDQGISDKAISPSGIILLREKIVWRLGIFIRTFKAQIVDGVNLAATLPEVHEQIRKSVEDATDDSFKENFGLGDVSSTDLISAKFKVSKELKRFHEIVEKNVIIERSKLVIRLVKGEHADELAKLRPLSLSALQYLVHNKNMPEVESLLVDGRMALVESEIEAILESADSLNPRIRIFYDKRTGVPRTDEPVKDPAIHRTISKDFYFILQDVDQEGKAFFRFFIKPQMALGLAGLAVVIFGTFMAFLPQISRRRREVA